MESKKNNQNQEEENIEEDIPEDIDIQEDEYNKIKDGSRNNSPKAQKYNSTGNNVYSPQANKPKNNTLKKKPFIAKNIKDSSLKKVNIIINANTFRDEYTMPIWCSKDSYIKFKVKGKWRIDRLYPYTDSKGLPSNNTGGLGYGALIGRIGNGDKFVISDDKTVVVKKEGALFMKQLLPKNMEIQPEGKLEVNVYDGEYMDIEVINQKMGWVENNISINNERGHNKSASPSKKKIEENNKKEMENKIRNTLNNLRMNPLMFYEQYITKSKIQIQTKQYLEKFNNEKLPALNSDEKCYLSIMNYLNSPTQQLVAKKVYRNNIVNYLLELEEELGFYLSNEFSRNIKVKCKLTDKNNPIDIIIRCFFDRKYRYYIFNKRSKDLTVNLIRNYYRNYSLIIMAFTFEKDKKENNSNE